MFTINNKISEIKKISKALTAFGEENRLPAQVICDAHLALEEIVVNIISYGFKDGDKHSIAINFELDGRELILEVQDEAPSFNPLEAPMPDMNTPVEERAVGGLGIYLVRKIMDKVEYHRKGGKNILIMRKTIIPEEERAGSTQSGHPKRDPRDPVD
ncbi:MAG: ATP-binding protein [bacterium]